MPITCFSRRANKDEFEKVNNEHSMLIDDYENNEDEDDEIKHCTMTKDVTCSAVASNDNNQKIKENEINNDESEHKEACVKCKINHEISSFTEAMHETLVSDLKK